MGRRSLGERELVEAFFSAYRKAWAGRYGKNYVGPFGADHARRARDVLRLGGSAREFLAMPAAFLRDGDGWLVGHGHPMNYLLKYPEKYFGKEAEGDGKAEGGSGYAVLGKGSADTEEAKAARRRAELAAFERHFGR